MTRQIPRILALLALLTSLASAQSVLIRVQQGNNVTSIPNNGSFAINSTGVGRPQEFNLTITYRGVTSLILPGPPQIFGVQDFSLKTLPPPDLVLRPNQSLTLEFEYRPSTSEASLAQLVYETLEAAPPPAVIPNQPTPPTPAPTPGGVFIGLVGTTPEYSLNYGLAADGNIVSAPPGGVVAFTETPVNRVTVASMILLNRGSGRGQVLSVSVSGPAFSLASLPLLPGFLNSGAALQFQVLYRPRQAGTDQGSLTINLEDGQSYTVALQGSGLSSLLSYALLPPDGEAKSIRPDEVISLPATSVGDRSTVFIRLANNTAFDIALGSIAVAGAAFTLGDLPFLPATIAPGQQQYFSITFRPTEPGRIRGRLLVGTDAFELLGNALGPQLSYSYLSPAGLTLVEPLGGVVFPNTQVGGISTIEFTIENTGTAPAPIQSLGIAAEGRSPFTLTGLPALPFAIAPNSSRTFSIQFAPLNTGFLTASLRINTAAFSLTANGITPEPLPAYTISGPSTVQPSEQPALGLTLAQPYAVALRGTLTLRAESEGFVNDPSIQFATGGPVVNFTIAAGSTRAVFSNGANTIRFQTGSVAGTIVVTPTFITEGGLDVTPENPPALRAVLPAGAPRLLSLSIDGRTATGFQLQAVGYSTTRSLTSMKVTFTGRPGFNFTRTEFTQDLTVNSSLWFNSQASVAFGGQFVLQLPFSFAISGGNNTPIEAIESVTLTVTNERGESNSITVQP